MQQRRSIHLSDNTHESETLSGEGVVQNNVFGHMWYYISSANGQNDASKWRDELKKKMTAAEIAKAQERASECVKKNYKGC